MLDHPRRFVWLAALWLAVQTIGVAHAADASLHSDGVGCHVCQHFDRLGMAPDAQAQVQPVAVFASNAPLPTLPAIQTAATPRPPARAPPFVPRR